jgi:hypothetical protein
MITKQTKIDKIEIVESGHIQIRERTDVIEDDIIISSSNHRYVLSPGDNIDNQPDNVKAITAIVWTPDVINKYSEAINNQTVTK